MFTQKAFADALQGDDSELAAAAGPDGVVVVAPELASVLVVADQVVLGRRSDDGVVEVRVLTLPAGFQVEQVTAEGGLFLLSGADGRVVHGTPAQFAAGDLDALVLDPFDDTPTADAGLGQEHVAAIAEAGEVTVTIGGRRVWVSFDDAGPRRIVELVPHVRELLASFERLGRKGAEFLADRIAGAEDDFDPEDYLSHMAPTTLVVHENGEFDVHYEGASGTEYYLDGYWPLVLFSRDGEVIDVAVDA